MKAVRIIAGLVAVLLIIVGAVVAVALGPDDTWAGEPAAIADGEAVVTTAPGLLNVAGVELAVTAVAGDGEVFIGASNPVHVEDYLTGVQRTRVTALAVDGIGGTGVVEGEQAYPGTPPGEFGVWSARTSGAGEQQLAVPLTDEAAVELVVMPTEAKGAAPEVGIGYTVPGAFVVGAVAALIGLVLLVTIVALGRRSRAARAAGGVTAGVEPATSPSSSGAVRRVVAVGSIALLAAGCTVPHQVDHGDAPSVVPLTHDEARTMLDDYDERNNAAIKKSHAGDASLWPTADTGPHLAVDVLGARTADVEGSEGEPGVGTHSVNRVYEVEQSTYPLSAVLVTEEEWNGEKAAAPDLDVFVKEHAARDWKGSSSVTVAEEDLPTVLAAEEATPDAADLSKAAEVDAMLQTWVEKGKAPGLEVTKELADLRAEITEVKKGADRVQVSADTWGGVDDPTGPAGSVRVVRVEEGLLVMTSQEWTTRIYLKQGYEWVQSEESAKIFGKQNEGNAQYVRRVLAAAVLVPETGDAQVLGSEVSRVIDYPRG